MDVNWTRIGKTEKIQISSRHTNPDGSKYSCYWLKFSCNPDKKYWVLPDISVTDEEGLDEEHGKTFTVPRDFIQYQREDLMEIRLCPLSLMRPLNLPPLDCVKAYHRE